MALFEFTDGVFAPMKRFRCRPLIARLTFMVLAFAPMAVFAQSRPLEIDIVGGNVAALPIAVVPFGRQHRRDRCRRHRPCRPCPLRTVPHARRGRPAGTPDPRQRSRLSDLAHAQAGLPAGRPQRRRSGDGYRVEYELFDVAKQQRLLGFALTAPASAMRDVAHQISRRRVREDPRRAAARSGPASPTSPPAGWAAAPGTR